MMSSDDLKHTFETSLSKMKYDFTSTGEQRYDTLNEITEQTNEKENKPSYFKFDFYQKYFNVNTSDVFYRIIGSMTPTFNQSFLINKIRPNPDLYGPFWICISLIFTIAIAGNVVSFLHNFGSDYKWHTDFHKVTSSAAVILTYWWLMPTILYILLRWRKTTTEFTFIEILCIYGYSLFIYIPIAMLWMINISILQWVLVLIAIILSGSVLVFTFWTSFSTDTNKKFAVFVMIMILVFHAALGLSFMLYFFHYPNTIKPEPILPSNVSNITTETQYNNTNTRTNLIYSNTTFPSTTLTNLTINTTTSSFISNGLNSTEKLTSVLTTLIYSFNSTISLPNNSSNQTDNI